MKKVLIDINSVVPYYASSQVTGIGRTTRELVHAFAELPELPVEIALYSQNMRGIGGKNLGTDFPLHHLYYPNRDRWNKALSYLPVREWLTGYDLMHIPHNFEYVHRADKCVATIHDAMFFTYPESFLGHDSARKLYPAFARKCRGIITCSQNSKHEIIEYMDVLEENVHVTHWGYDVDLLYPRERKSNQYCATTPFFLSVSCSKGRKNTISVVRAFEQFVKDDPYHHLLLIWRNPSKEVLELSSKPHMKGRVHITSEISDQELAQLYSDATATFFPSKYEGFGLPVLESLASGTPVVTCRNSSLEEVGGDAALYVEPEDVESMAKLMAAFENKSLDYSKLVSTGLLQARQFTWRQTAQKTIEAYKQCLD